jgi:hypothetical protein
MDRPTWADWLNRSLATRFYDTRVTVLWWRALTFMGARLSGEKRLWTQITRSRIQHTVRYTELSPARFKSFWND